MSKLRKKAITWLPHHEAILLDLWEETIGALRSAQKNFHIYEPMCEKLLEADFSVTWKELRKMTKMYK